MLQSSFRNAAAIIAYYQVGKSFPLDPTVFLLKSSGCGEGFKHKIYFWLLCIANSIPCIVQQVDQSLLELRGVSTDGQPFVAQINSVIDIFRDNAFEELKLGAQE